MKGTFTINVGRLPPEGSDFDFTIEPGWLSASLESEDILPPRENGSIRLRVSPVGGNFYVKGKVVVRLSMTCGCCLREVPVELKVPLEVLMVKGRNQMTTTPGRKGDNVGVQSFHGDEMVLDEEVRQALIIEIPMNPRCAGGCSLEDLYGDEAGDAAPPSPGKGPGKK